MHPETARDEAVALPKTPIGEVRLLPLDDRTRLRGALDAAQLLVVTVEDLGPGARGRLGERIDDAIEGALRARGGAAPGISTACDLDATLSDQLYRARRLGKVGLALDVGSLVGLTDARGALEPDDGATLRFFADTTRERPFVLLLDAANADVRMYGAPQPLSEALPISGAIRIAKPKAQDSIERREPPKEDKPAPRAPTRAPRVYVSVSRVDDEAESLARAMIVLEETGKTTPLTGLEQAFLEGYAPLRAAMIGERLAQAGVPHDRAYAVCARFEKTFAHAYTDALPTFANTGRHPRMVFELFDLASRSLRIHGARAVQIVLVDGLRYDLGARIRVRLAAALAQKAVCVDAMPLWSVLPTTTATQLDALVRGDDALRAPKETDRETSIIRGRSIDILRRTRIGHRDVLKLDTIEGRIREAGASEHTRLEALADEVSGSVERLIRTSLPRTLVVVVGDHGFTFGAEPGHLPDPQRETAPAKQGGASPEEVFVPFQAWLVGGLH